MDCCSSTVSLSQKPSNATLLSSNIPLQKTLFSLPHTLTKCRDLHKIPELGFEELKTSQYIR